MVLGLTLLVLAVGLVVLLLVMAGGVQSPRQFASAPEQLTTVPAPSGPAPTTLTIVSWNIAWGYGFGSEGSGQARPAEHFERTVEAMGAVLAATGADLVLLQEVDFDSRRSHHVDQAKRLAERAGLPYVARAESWTAPWVPFPYWPPKEHFGTMHSGGAILSRFPIVAHDVELLPKPDENPFWYNLFYLFRYLERAEIQVGPTTLSVFNTHLEAFKQQNRLAQVERTLTRLRAEMRPALIYGGDLNAVPPESPQKHGYPDEPETDHRDDPTITRIRALEGLSDTVGSSTISARAADFFTFPAHAPNRKLDHLFVGAGVKVLEVRVVKEAGASSDHLPLLIRIELSPG